MKSLVLLLCLLSVTFAQVNSSGYKDTAIVYFQGVDSGYTKAFELSQYENMSFAVSADDTLEAGFADDSTNFRWGIQRGIVFINSSNRQDTSWRTKYELDTFDILTAANMVVQTTVVDTSGNAQEVKGFIDTVGVTGRAVQECSPLIRWAPLVRFWYVGLAGNRVEDGNIRTIFSMTRRIASYVRM